eukprot:gnl/Spiro4/27020_TR13438_c0_g1_i1.p1 gnl/Spiro4/27020_TR13438_c0_g1~~gnl/Spiro4/27020_TR13438_c0_g1_i1.p1  ORF type:complete len:493 (-),score=107.55 gnl/Spiro4/27020_TR13438_c0_g1_i1:17-1495(-)
MHQYVILLSVAFGCLCSARIIEFNESVFPYSEGFSWLMGLESFGFAKGGTLSIENPRVDVSFLPLEPTIPTKYIQHPIPLSFFLINYDQLIFLNEVLSRDQHNTSLICSMPCDGRFDIPPFPRADSTHPWLAYGWDGVRSVRIRSTSMYHLAVVNCVSRLYSYPEYGLTVQGKATFLNLEGEHLQAQEVPLLHVTFLLLVLYLVLLLAYSMKITSSLFRRSNQLTSLNFALFALLLMETVAMAMQSGKYQSLSQSGDSAGHLTATLVVTIAAESMFMLVSLLGALGWTVTRPELGIKEIQIAFILLLFYAMGDGATEQCTDRRNLCVIFILVFVILKFLVKFGILVAINANIDQLRRALFEDPTRSPLETIPKLRVFETLRPVFVLFVLSPIFTGALDFLILTWKQQWLLWTFDQLIQFAVTVALCVTFLPGAALPLAGLPALAGGRPPVPLVAPPAPAPPPAAAAVEGAEDQNATGGGVRLDSLIFGHALS